MSWLIGRNELTVEQSRAVELSPRDHRLVLGSPGSGKTIVLLHRARQLVENYGITPERFRLFVYTNALKDYIRAGLRDLALPEECAMTFDSWCFDYYRKTIGHKLPWNRNERSYDWDGIQNAVWERSRRLTASERLYDFVMVDEGQDLAVRDFQTLASIAKHVTVFMDPKQKIYEKDATEAGVAQALGLRRSDLTLLEAYRCSPYIVRAAAAFIRDDEEKRRFIEQNPPIEKGERQVPLLYLANDEYDELKQLIDALQTRIDRNERIAILVPTAQHMFQYASLLYDAGLEVEIKQRSRTKEEFDDEDIFPGIDFHTSLPKLMPYPSSKGLTFDTVLMPSLKRNTLQKFDDARVERLLFVGISRATRWIQFSTTNAEEVPFIERFQELERQGQITIQRNTDLLDTDHPTESANDGTSEDDPLSGYF